MVLASIADHRLLALTKTLTTLSPEDRTNAVERLSLKSLGEPLPKSEQLLPQESDIMAHGGLPPLPGWPSIGVS